MSDLPIDASRVYTLAQQCRPADTTVDLKSTSFKSERMPSVSEWRGMSYGISRMGYGGKGSCRQASVRSRVCVTVRSRGWYAGGTRQHEGSTRTTLQLTTLLPPSAATAYRCTTRVRRRTAKTRKLTEAELG